jgi:hypothetical protein
MFRIALFPIVTTLALTCGSLSTLATSERTEQLYWKCVGRDKIAEMGQIVCAGYLDGLVDMHSLMVGLSKSKPMFCPLAIRRID